MTTIFQFILVTVNIFCIAIAGDFMPCKINDFDCQLKSAKAYSSIFAQGIPSLKLPTLDPLHLGNIKNKEKGLDLKFSNVVVNGLKATEIESWRMDFQKLSLQLSIVCKVVIEGDYILGGRLLILPIEGNGQFTINAKKLKSAVNAELAKKTTNDGKEFWQISKYSYKVDPLDVVFDFKNLFNGNKQLSDVTHNFANTNFKEVIIELGGPILESILKKAIKQINTFLRKVPKEELFLE